MNSHDLTSPTHSQPHEDLPPFESSTTESFYLLGRPLCLSLKWGFERDHQLPCLICESSPSIVVSTHSFSDWIDSSTSIVVAIQSVVPKEVAHVLVSILVQLSAYETFHYASFLSCNLFSILSCGRLDT